MPSNEYQLTRSKLGPLRSPAAAAGDAAEQTVTGQVQKLGPLPDGAYTIESSVVAYAQQGGPSVDRGFSAPQGVKLAPDTPETFLVEGPHDAYVVWVSAEADGKLRINDRTDTGAGHGG